MRLAGWASGKFDSGYVKTEALKIGMSLEIEHRNHPFPTKTVYGRLFAVIPEECSK